MSNTIVKIENWSKQRDLDTADPYKQMLKLVEEVGELAHAMARGNNDLVIDSIGDIVVVLTILSQQMGLRIEDCINYSYDVIKDRKGKMINGVFVKEEDLK